MIDIKKIKCEATYDIRLEVLRKGIPLPYKFRGDFDEDTFHLGVFKDDKLIAVSSYMKVNDKSFQGEGYQLRGMATLKEFQGCGAGKEMMDFAFEILKEKSIDYLWCNARIVAVKFYEKQGLEIIGDAFDVQYIGTHYKMFKKI